MPEQSLPVAESGYVVRELIAVIRDHRDELSAIDAEIGDGDHGINMTKGFNQCAAKLDEVGDASLLAAFEALSEALLEGIGGSMGPLYGSFFMSFGEALEGREVLDAEAFGTGLHEALAAIQMLGEARVGDKTLMDTLVPAVAAYDSARAEGADFAGALAAMRAAAEAGRDSTRDLQARVGRAARLGERSLGVLDAGAASCFLILRSMADSIMQRLDTSA